MGIDALVAFGWIVPAIVAFVALSLAIKARNTGDPSRAWLFAVVGVAALCVTLWAMSFFTFPIDDP